MLAQLIKFENFSMAFSKRIITMDFDRFGYKWSKETETKHKCELYIGYKNILTSRFAEYFHFPSLSGASFEITFWGRTKCRNFLTLIIKMHYLIYHVHYPVHEIFPLPVYFYKTNLIPLRFAERLGPNWLEMRFSALILSEDRTKTSRTTLLSVYWHLCVNES